MNAQLALNLRLRDGSSFENFLPGRNREALSQARAMAVAPAGFRSLYLYGDRGSGKTHLLEAACRECADNGPAPFYLSLREVGALDPSMLEGVERHPVVCLDDLGEAAGRPAWEEALLSLWERCRPRPVAWLVAATAPPDRLGLKLADLATRLATAAAYALHVLSDEEKLSAMQLRAGNRGLELPEEVARYILNRYPRDLATLFALLDRLDDAALARQRRLTIPLIREVEENP
jgi:DnaA family protein